MASSSSSSPPPPSHSFSSSSSFFSGGVGRNMSVVTPSSHRRRRGAALGLLVSSAVLLPSHSTALVELADAEGGAGAGNAEWNWEYCDAVEMEFGWFARKKRQAKNEKHFGTQTQRTGKITKAKKSKKLKEPKKSSKENLRQFMNADVADSKQRSVFSAPPEEEKKKKGKKEEKENGKKEEEENYQTPNKYEPLTRRVDPQAMKKVINNTNFDTADVSPELKRQLKQIQMNIN